MMSPTRKTKKPLYASKKRIKKALAFMASIWNKMIYHNGLCKSSFEYIEEAETIRKEYIKNLETSVLFSSLIMDYVPTSIRAPSESNISVRKKWRPFSEKKNLLLKGKGKCKHNNFKGNGKA